MLIEQPPRLLRLLYPTALWRMDVRRRRVYLTFDDGPVPRVTPWVLRQLRRRGIRATFFMVADNALRYPHLVRRVRAEGHSIGSHGRHHLPGLYTPTPRYVADAMEACRLLHTRLYRPPHGLMRPAQYRALKAHCRIVMWDVVTRDYSRRLTGPQVLANVRRYTRAGSVITFHDSYKAETRLRYALPRALDWLMAQGYTFGVMEEDEGEK